MGILGSVTRYLKTYGRLMYADPRGFGAVVPSRRKKKTPKAAYLEMLEPRVLMTTVYGGETFQYTDALGNTVTTTLNGNVVSELVGAVQAGGTSGKTANTTTSGGYLIFGDIVGQFTAGPRQTVIVGNGSIPVDNGRQGSTDTPHITIPGDNYPSVANPGDQVPPALHPGRRPRAADGERDPGRRLDRWPALAVEEPRDRRAVESSQPGEPPGCHPEYVELGSEPGIEWQAGSVRRRGIERLVVVVVAV